MHNGQLEEIIFAEIKRKIENNDADLKIASLPEIILKVNEVIADDNKGICDIAEVIQTDTAVSTRLIRVSNSPAMRGMYQVKDVKDAINRVGTEIVKNLALCVMMIDRFQAKDPHEKKLLQTYTANSLEHSVTNFAITKYFTNLKAEPAILIGLIHNVGHLIVLSYLHEHYSGMESKTLVDIADSIGADVGKIILQKWNFPDTLVNSAFSQAEIELTLDDIATYTHAYGMAKMYLADELPEELAARITEQMDLHKDDLDELRATFV